MWYNALFEGRHVKDEIEYILGRLTARSKSGAEYEPVFARLTWIGREYSKEDLVNDLGRALNGNERDTKETD
jgi:hypothetical protein